MSRDLLQLFRRMADGLPTHEELLAQGSCSEAAAHPELNRYCDCWPVDSHLATSGGGGYINASLLRPRAGAMCRYIAAAGPMAPDFYGPDTRPAFWSMVWHHKVTVIVALARPQAGVRGCAEYATPKSSPHGDIALELVEERPSLGGNAVERRLHLRRGAEVHLCLQLEFRAWPDYGVPEAANALAKLIRRVDELRAEAAAATVGGAQEEEEETEPPPLLVHCAGGVGRTGSFITAHSLHCQQQEAAAAPVGDEARDEARDEAKNVVGGHGRAGGLVVTPEDVAARIALLRAQRHPYVVETPEQFGLIVDVLNELRAGSAMGR